MNRSIHILNRLKEGFNESKINKMMINKKNEYKTLKKPLHSYVQNYFL